VEKDFSVTNLDRDGEVGFTTNKEKGTGTGRREEIRDGRIINFHT